MPAPVVTPLNPLAGATNQSSAVAVDLRITATLPATLAEHTVEVAVGPNVALASPLLAGDAGITAGSLVIQSASRTFGPDDLGAAVYTIGAPNARDRGRAHVKSLPTATSVRVTRAPLAGTVSVVNGSATVTGTGTTFLADLQPGDWVVFNDSEPAYQIAQTSIPTPNPLSNVSVQLTTLYGGTTAAGLTITRAFATSATAFDWVVQRFEPGFGGTLVPAGGGANGYDVQVWRAQELVGTAQSTGLALVGTGTRFSSELHAGSRVLTRGKRPSDPYAVVATVASDTSAVISAYPAGPVGPWRAARDLPGSSIGTTPTTITATARDSNGLSVTSTYGFTVGLRPRLTLADGQAANPFGMAVRVAFSDDMLAWTPGLNPALAAPGTYRLAVLAGTAAVPNPPVPVISSVTVPAGNPSYVDLVLAAPQVHEARYRVTVASVGLRADTGNHVGDPSDDAAEFAGYGPYDVVQAVKDTRVTVPEIAGPTIVAFGTQVVTCELHNLDVDVQSVQLGPSATGVTLVPGSFVSRRLDPDPALRRTGQFEVALTAGLGTYRVTVVVTDDVDNQSAESDPLVITVAADTVPGTALVIRPHDPVDRATCLRLMDDIPAGTFYLRSGTVVPYTIDSVPFRLDVVERGLAVEIAITHEGAGGRPESRFLSIVPTSLVETVDIPLSRGRNIVYATDGVRTTFALVSATSYATVLCAIASELYGYALVQLEDVQRAIFGRLSTRLADPYIEFADILPFPALQSQQVMSTKMVVRAHVSGTGRERSVRDVVAAVTLGTPVTVPVHNPNRRWQPAVDRLRTAQESFGGFDQHVWLHDECVARWTAFARWTDNHHQLARPLVVSADEIVTRLADGRTNRHAFDPESACSTVDARTTCFDGLRVRLTFAGELVLPICAAAYPFDSCFSSAFPLGSSRVSFDSPIPWDSLMPLDSDPLDPGDDGWAGLCWSDRWDSGRILLTLADGVLTAGTNAFTSAGHPFVAQDVGRWVDMLDGPRPGRRRIVSVAGGTAHLDRTQDISGTAINWRLVADVRVLDSTGAVPSDPLVSFTGDGSVVVGTDVFTTAGQYAFGPDDLGRNLEVVLPDGPVGLYITEIVGEQLARVGRPTGTSIVPYVWSVSATGLAWTLWDPRAQRCAWDHGYAVLLASLASADMLVPVPAVLTVKTAFDLAPDFEGSATLLGSGSILVTPRRVAYGTADLPGTASVLATPGNPVEGSATLTGRATLDARTYQVLLAGSAGMTARGTVNNTPDTGESAALLLSTGSMWAPASALMVASAALAGTASLVTGAPAVSHAASAALAGASSLLAVPST